MLGAAAVFLGGASLLMQHDAAQDQAEILEAVGAANAAMLNDYADDLELIKADRVDIAGSEAEMILREGEEVRSEGRAAFAARNVVVDQGSAYQWSQGIDADVQGDLIRLRENLGRELGDIGRQQKHIRQQAAMAAWEGQIGAQSALTSGYANLVSSGASMLGAWASK